MDERLSEASRRFLRNLVAHSSERDVDVWLHAARRALESAGDTTDPEAVLVQLLGAHTDPTKVDRRVLARLAPARRISSCSFWPSASRPTRG
ncbi:MAG: hypothetical protein LC792_05475 [Actinobacteria bacterium]|nr:hypothetical protein [Actinomycetota bacterium]